MAELSACDVWGQSYGGLKLGRIYSLNYLHIILMIIEFNSNGDFINFNQAKVWNIVNKHINFVFSAVWLVFLIFNLTTLGRSVCRPNMKFFLFWWTASFKTFSSI